MIEPDVDEQMRRISEKTAEVFPAEEMRKKVEKSVATGRPLRAKLGVDPTAPDVHLGNAVPLWKLRAFQDLGHVAVLIIGDYTAMVGDPSGRNSLRPMLTKEQVESFAQTYLDQVGKVLLPDRLEIRRNSQWLAPMTFMDVLKLQGRMTVSQMLERDDFHLRFEKEVPIGLHEFLYPLMQGWDSVIVEADVELGGTDQRFNLLVGRNLLREEGRAPQALVINPLVAGTDGAKKMSKSGGNYVGITEPPNEMFGKSMSIPDALMRDWLTYFTSLDASRVAELCDPGKTHPRAAKEEMSKAIVARYHGSEAADAAASEFKRVFSKGEAPREATVFIVPARSATEDAVRIYNSTIIDILVDSGLAASRSKARTLVTQGAVAIDDVRVLEPDTYVGPPDTNVRHTLGDRCVFLREGGSMLRVGRHFVRLMGRE